MRLAIDAAGADANARAVGFELVNLWLVMHRQLSDVTGLRPAALLVWATVAIASAQRFMRAGPVPDALRGRTPLPRAEVGGISRRGIARATGLPVETVRRLVAGLMARGALIEGDDGLVRTGGGTAERATAEQLREALAAVARVVDVLGRAGVVRAA